MSYRSTFGVLISGIAALCMTSPAAAALVNVKVTLENLAPSNSIGLAPLRFGFGNGTFDAFENGQAATAPIISVAEGGSGADWFPAFAAAEPMAVLGSTMGPALPGGMTMSAVLKVDTAVNPYFTFASMVIPSNDHFIGNDDPMQYLVFDNAGMLLVASIVQFAGDIWNAGSEAFDPANAAFLVAGDNNLRTPEGGVVGFDSAELAGYDGMTTAAGYVFQSGLTATTPIGRISFTATPVPEPPASALFGFGAVALMGFAAIRRKSGAAAA